MSLKKSLILALSVVFFSVLAINAQISDKISIHGFGAWSYGNTDGSHYLTGDEDGDYDHSQFYLNINANPFEKLSIIAQIGAHQGHHGVEFEFDYAFAEWAFTDAFKLRLGKVKHPYGIFGEVLNVGTIRPFFSLPQGIYGNNGFVGRGINGISATGSFQSKKGWGLVYDVYWGQLKNVLEHPNILSYAFSQDPNLLNDGVQTAEKDIVSLIGGRLAISTPLEGLSIGISGYSGDEKADKTEEGGGYQGDQKSFGLHLEYLTANMWIRGEFMKHAESAITSSGISLDRDTDCLYVEAAYKFLKNWQAAVRYDWAEGSLSPIDLSLLPRYFQEYMKHKDIAFGLNYWFNPNFVIKLSYHMVEGIMFGWPHFEDAIAFLMGDFNNKTKLFQFGVHFSF
jgi:hypothetical protein